VNAKQQIKYNDWMPHDPIAEIELHNRRVLKSLLIEMAVEEFSAPNSDTRHLQLALSLQANLTRQTLNGKRALPPAEHEQLVLPAVELRQPPKQLEAPAETTARRSLRKEAPTTPEPPPVEEETHTHRTDLKHRMIAHAKAHGGKFLLTQWAASEKAIGKYGGVGGGAYTYLRDKKLFRYTGPGEYTLVARAAK
jgi:hypothetical protein